MSQLRYQLFRMYQKLPPVLVSGIVSAIAKLPKKIVLGNDYVYWERSLEESQYWDSEKIRQFQDESIRKMVKHAFENVPFYKREMTHRSLTPEKINGAQDLYKLPIIKKQHMLDEPGLFEATGGYGGKRIKIVTSGSSGTPLHYYSTPSAQLVERAFVAQVWKWAGYRFREPAFRIKAKRDPRKTEFFDVFQNTIEFYPISVDSHFAQYIAKRAEEFSPTAIFGYPSYLYLLAKLVSELGLEKKFRSVRVFIAGSEKVFYEQRRLIDEVFGVHLVEFYGNTEQVALFGQCEKYGCLHEFPQYSYVELLNETGGGAQEGEFCSVVGTSFLNKAWPFIRYEIGDLLKPTTTKCDCDRNTRCVEEVLGRYGDFIKTPSGKMISPTSIEFAFRYLLNVKEHQIIQEEIDQIIVYIVPSQNYKPEMSAFLVNEIKDRIREPMSINIKLVDLIERPPSQKQRFVVSKIK
jgi:phenylacetate-CoA ligase